VCAFDAPNAMLQFCKFFNLDPWELVCLVRGFCPLNSCGLPVCYCLVFPSFAAWFEMHSVVRLPLSSGVSIFLVIF
jgi:hypothetical protein